MVASKVAASFLGGPTSVPPRVGEQRVAVLGPRVDQGLQGPLVVPADLGIGWDV